MPAALTKIQPLALLTLFAIAAFALTRGVQGILTQSLVGRFDALTLTAAAILTATACYLPYLALSGRLALLKSRGLWRAGALLSLPNLLIPFAAFTWCQLFITATTTSLIAGLIPVVVAILGAALGNARITAWTSLAISLGLAGTIVLVAGGGEAGAIAGAPAWAMWAGVAIAMIGVLSAATVYCCFSKTLESHDLPALLGAQLVVASAVMIAVMPWSFNPQIIHGLSDLGFATQILLFALTGFILPQLAALWLIANAGALLASVGSYLAPVTTAALAAAFLGQSITQALIFAGVLILASAGLMSWAQQTRRTDRFELTLEDEMWLLSAQAEIDAQLCDRAR